MVRRALVLLPLLLALAACGGGGGLTKAQYAAKVSHLCLVASDAFRELHLSGSQGDFRRYGPEIVRIDKVFVQQLAKLNPPAVLAAPAAGFARTHQAVARDDKAAISAARTLATATFRATIIQAHNDERETFRFAKAIGATGCYIS